MNTIALVLVATVLVTLVSGCTNQGPAPDAGTGDQDTISDPETALEGELDALDSEDPAALEDELFTVLNE
ncbi:MAG: hypothetical protein HY369_01535 [Candidatus Aenigmarchaeota archaeon]|nr:hypothetical protein [Candidatus Aenigmarchaeota archaeon]